LPSDRAVFTGVSTGYEHSCATSTGGQAYCWGLNNLGQLGNGTRNDLRVPTAIDGGRTVSAISSGNGHTCAVVSGDVYCWGANVNGQIGNGTLDDQLLPTLISFAGASVVNR
jgi:alpha-tubulin suppressor-like RCC1 family protein